jgi:hypothetical protein
MDSTFNDPSRPERIRLRDELLSIAAGMHCSIYGGRFDESMEKEFMVLAGRAVMERKWQREGAAVEDRQSP